MRTEMNKGTDMTIDQAIDYIVEEMKRQEVELKLQIDKMDDDDKEKHLFKYKLNYIIKPYAHDWDFIAKKVIKLMNCCIKSALESIGMDGNEVEILTDPNSMRPSDFIMHNNVENDVSFSIIATNISEDIDKLFPVYVLIFDPYLCINVPVTGATLYDVKDVIIENVATSVMCMFGYNMDSDPFLLNDIIRNISVDMFNDAISKEDKENDD